MNDDKTAKKMIDMACPICRKNYQTPKKLPAPTCGNPSCIREARDRGLPFCPQAPELPVKEKKPKKPKKGKTSPPQAELL